MRAAGRAANVAVEPRPRLHGGGVGAHIAFREREGGNLATRHAGQVFAFLFLTAVLMPALAVATVGSYGLAVWVYQMMAGPPGPPAQH